MSKKKPVVIEAGTESEPLPDRTEIRLIERWDASAADLDLHDPDFDPYDAAIQDVLADPGYQHVGAHGTEVHAVRKLVERGHDQEMAEREVRRRLY